MRPPRIRQQCPMCPEMLDFEVTVTAGEKNDRGGVDMHIEAQTTPESTAHVWTHKPEGES